MQQLYYSARFVKPFCKVLYNYPECNQLRQDFSRFLKTAPNDRLPVSVGCASLDDYVEFIKDPAIGLKAGRLISLGAGGPLDFAMQSAPTIRESIGVAIKYGRLFCDAIELGLIEQRERATLRIDFKTFWPRAAAEFVMSACYTNHIRNQLENGASIECWFAHKQPPDLAEYELTFPSANLSFNAPYFAFSFSRENLELPLAGADARLHAVLLAQVDMMLNELCSEPNLTFTVRQQIARNLPQGNPTAQHIAHELRISRRTLVRRLDNEGTTFSAELDKLRRELALQYVKSRNVPLMDVATLLGFSYQSAFNRAFKRWTGKTPCQYRESDMEARLGIQ